MGKLIQLERYTIPYIRRYMNKLDSKRHLSTEARTQGPCESVPSGRAFLVNIEVMVRHRGEYFSGTKNLGVYKRLTRDK